MVSKKGMYNFLFKKKQMTNEIDVFNCKIYGV